MRDAALIVGRQDQRDPAVDDRDIGVMLCRFRRRDQAVDEPDRLREAGELILLPQAFLSQLPPRQVGQRLPDCILR